MNEYNQDNRPSVEELSKLAAKGRKPDYGLTAAEWLLWYELRDIYADHRAGTHDPDRLKKRKEEAVVRYETMTTRDKEWREAAFRLAEVWKAVELTAAEYRKRPSMETADKMMNVLYGLIGGG